MKVVLQRVSGARVVSDNVLTGEIGQGLAILFGAKTGDSREMCEYLAKKIANLRIFKDENGKLNRSVNDIGGEILVVSNFTLCGECDRGTRPNFSKAEGPEKAYELFKYFKECLKSQGVKKVASGVFGSHMKLSLENDGPVTIILDTDELRAKK